MLNVSGPSGTPRAPARPATRSTEERAFAPPASGVLASPTGSRPAPYLFRHAVPSLFRHTLAPRTPCSTRSSRHSSFSSEASVHCRCSPSFSSSPSPRSLRFSVGTRDGRAIGLVLPASRPVSRNRSASWSTEPEGFTGCQASGVRAVLVSHSRARRRSNPGMQRTRYARR